MSDAEIIYLPQPKLERVRNPDWLWEELERAERRVEDIKRVLGILAVERGLSDGDETA
ncbi:hypothetical protein QFZ60_001540 [Arthrobacter sp. B2I5]|uniref:hypothetical protein n=1 Tax=Arthrobacter sp. B2I5 TaxID=3042266 RepID=UPI002784AEB1|nr:hypothetical protein [Arthrobacter sp. B2I5]MDQ0825367.1 hypothetical protein [Arthrobacter sp. B2I5]